LHYYSKNIIIIIYYNIIKYKRISHIIRNVVVFNILFIFEAYILLFLLFSIIMVMYIMLLFSFIIIIIIKRDAAQNLKASKQQYNYKFIYRCFY
jgi:K+-sensing histidine kinase KdpD